MFCHYGYGVKLYRTWFGVAGLAVGVGTSVVKGIQSSNQEKQGKAELAQTKQPFEKVQDEYYQNRNLAMMRATGGLDPNTANLLDTERNRRFSSTASALKEAGLDPSAWEGLLTSFDESLNQQAALGSQKHDQNLQYFMQANKDLAGQKTQQWTVNEYAPFENKLADITRRREAAQENFANAISEAGQSVSSFGTSMMNRNLMKGLFKNQDTSFSGDLNYAKVNPSLGQVTDMSIDTSRNLPALTPAITSDSLSAAVPDIAKDE